MMTLMIIFEEYVSLVVLCLFFFKGRGAHGDIHRVDRRQRQMCIRERITYLALVIIYIFLFSFFYGIYTYRAVKMQDDITVRYNDNEDISGKPIGKVGNTLFLLTGSVVQIIPTDSYVKSITIPLKE